MPHELDMHHELDSANSARHLLAYTRDNDTKLYPAVPTDEFVLGWQARSPLVLQHVLFRLPKGTVGDARNNTLP